MPTVVKKLHIAAGAESTVWDYRAETPPNGGRIQLRACVWHGGERRENDEESKRNGARTCVKKGKGRVQRARVPYRGPYVNWRAVSHARGTSRAHDPATR